MKTVLLLGRTPFDLDDWRSFLARHDLNLMTGTTLAEVHQVFEEASIDHVIMGAGLTLEDRLAIVKLIFEASDGTTVHMKDRASGKTGMRRFVDSLLTGLGGK